jgi:hypothetical protein
MKKDEFLKDDDVRRFIDWLVSNLPELHICLRLKRSKFVPNGVDKNFTGFGNVLPHYIWKSSGMVTGDWRETKTHLSTLSNTLRTEVVRGSEPSTLDACRGILEWGGNRNFSVGAFPFLRHLASNSELCDYISNTANTFLLNAADEASLAPPVAKMNAMLTKVHALYAQDGLPIYDSRVAAAIASLVEIWRRDNGKEKEPLPNVLTFPATMISRTVLKLFPSALHPGVLIYGSNTTPAAWSSAKVRLAWIMEAVLLRLQELFAAEGRSADRMHAFEASLFMIGYDVTCFGCKNANTTQSGVESRKAYEKEYKKAFNALQKEGEISGPEAYDMRIPSTLGGDGGAIDYSGDLESGFKVKWENTRFLIQPEFLNELVNDFSGKKNVPLGASMNGVLPENSLGQWMIDNGWPQSRYPSAIAAILHDQKIVTKFSKLSTRGNPICLDF